MQAGELLENSLIKRLATEHTKEPAQVVLRWHIQSGLIVIPKSITPKRIRSNLDIFDFELSADEMKKIDSLNVNKRIGPHPNKL